MPWPRDGNRGIGGIERVERYRDLMPIGDRKYDEDDAERNQHQSREKSAHESLSRWRRPDQVAHDHAKV